MSIEAAAREIQDAMHKCDPYDVPGQHQIESILRKHLPAGDAREEAAWLIERYFNGELRYFVGTHTDERGFLPDAEKAIRFSREQDAAYVLSWLLGGNGRAVQHGWAPMPPQHFPAPGTRGESERERPPMPCAWCGQPEHEHRISDGLCPVPGVSSQFYTPKPQASPAPAGPKVIEREYKTWNGFANPSNGIGVKEKVCAACGSVLASVSGPTA